MKVFAGSTPAFLTWWAEQALDPATVVVVTSGAAFATPLITAQAMCSAIGGGEIVHVIDRASATDAANAARVRAAQLVICLDGSALHARTLWRHSVVGDALATGTVAAIGTVGSVFGATMIDPRGGAPTTGMGLFHDVAITTMADDEQRRRTYALLGDGVTLIEVGPTGVVYHEHDQWHIWGGEVVSTRAGKARVL